MVEGKHTPGEMYVSCDDEHVGGIPFIEIDIRKAGVPGSVSIAEVQPILDDSDEFVLNDEVRANAARLVLCWNTHDQLVEALTSATQFIEGVIKVANLKDNNGALAACRAALSAANGEDKSNG